MGPGSPKYTVETDDHPQDVDAGRRVSAVRSTIQDEARTRKDIQPLVKWRMRAEPSGVQQDVRQQHHCSCRPPNNLNDDLQHRVSPGASDAFAMSRQRRVPVNL